MATQISADVNTRAAARGRNTTRLVIIDYGMGNLRSVRNALQFLGYDPVISDQPADISVSDGVILPGVGAFGEAMHNLRQRGLIDVLHRKVIEEKAPFLGICLGMQLLAQDSEEMGQHEGLGWIPGHVVQLRPGHDLRVPHVGWNSLDITRPEPLFRNMGQAAHCYFDHMFHLECPDDLVTARCNYGARVVAAINRDNIFATQFHPEKSQVAGLRLLRNFLNQVEASLS